MTDGYCDELEHLKARLTRLWKAYDDTDSPTELRVYNECVMVAELTMLACGISLDGVVMFHDWLKTLEGKE